MKSRGRLAASMLFAGVSPLLVVLLVMLVQWQPTQVSAQFDCESEATDYNYSCPAEGLESLSTVAFMNLNYDAAQYTNGSASWADLADEDGSTDDAIILSTSQEPAYRKECLDGNSPCDWHIYYFHLNDFSYIPLNYRIPRDEQVESFTVAVWFRSFYLDATDGWFQQQSLIDFDRSNYWGFYVTPAGYGVLSTHHSNDAIVDTAEDVNSYVAMTGPNAEWHFLVATFGCEEGTGSDCGGVVRIYRDGLETGVSDSSATGTGFPVGGNASTAAFESRVTYGIIGDGSESRSSPDSGNNENFFKGDVSMVTFWDHTFAESEVEDAWDATKKFYQSCDEGYYCDYGYVTTVCPAGSYCPGDWLKYDCGTGLTEPNTVYCAGGSSQTEPTPVDNAYYSTGETSVNRTGQAICPAGSYCENGTRFDCGGNDVYCPGGTNASITVSPGFYSVGGSELKRTGQLECSKGTYCVDGVAYDCPAGRYGASTGLTNSSCSGTCDAGYYCGNGSSSAQNADCVEEGTTTFPENHYCPEGTSKVLTVPDGFYSLPELDSALYNRENITACSDSFVCTNGSREALLEWNDACADGEANVRVRENKVEGSHVSSFNVTNRNDGASVTFNLSGPSASNFSILTNASATFAASDELVAVELLTAMVFDYEVTDSYVVEITARTGPSTVSCLVDVDIVNVNDQPYIPANQTRNVSERSSINTAVNGGELYAEDQDRTDSIAFEIVEAFPADAFEFFDVGTCSGLIFMAKGGIAFNDYPVVVLNITVTDDGREPRMDSANVTIFVLDVNDAPEFGQESYTFSIDEKPVSVGDQFGAVNASDEDEGNTLTYSITSDVQGVASINNSTGALYLAEKVDYETRDTYTLTVQVADSEFTDEASVTLNVLDVNEAPDVEFASVSVDENVPLGTNVSTTDARSIFDPEDGSSGTYTFGIDAPWDAFGIDENSGALIVNTSLNYERRDNYTVNVSVADSGGETTWAPLNVAINDVNEDPSIERDAENLGNGLANAIEIYENLSIGDSFYTVSVSDPDSGDLHTVKMIDASGQPISMNNDGGFFSIENADNASTQLSMVTTGELDYETTTSAFNVSVRIRDDGGLSDSLWYTLSILDANDAPVADDKSVTFTVEENFVGRVGRVNTTDEDDTSTGWGVLEHVALAFTDNFTFTTAASDQQTGLLDVVTALDYETKEDYFFDVNVLDTAAPVLQDSYTVTITVADANDDPTITSAGTIVSVPEELTETVIVGYITADDEDSVTVWETVYYSLLGISPWASNLGATTPTVTVDRDTGAISVDATSLERRDNYTLLVQAANNDTAFYDIANMTMTVVQENSGQTVEDKIVDLTIDENGADQRLPTPIQMTDIDDEDTLSFSISACTVNQTETSCGTSVKSMFSLDAIKTSTTEASYDVYLQYNATDTTNVNYEASIFDDVPDGEEHALRITVSGTDGSLVSTASFVLAVQDVNEAPTIDSGVFSIDEDLSVGSYIGSLANKLTPEDEDEDEDATTLTYLFAKTWTTSYPPFNISGTGLYLESAVDYESQRSYSFDIAVVDAGNLNATGETQVLIDNVNEAPVFGTNYSYSLTENNKAGATVGTVAATDVDDDDTLTYTMISGDTDTFDLGSASGVITATESFDYEQNTSFSFRILVEDAAGLQDKATVDVTIGDENDMTVTTIDPNDFDTEGASGVVLTGTNIGAKWMSNSDILVRATFANGLDTLTYVAENCSRVGASNTRIRCDVPAGVGPSHEWTVSVWSASTSGYRANATVDETTSFNAPAITGVTTSEEVSTNGNTTITISGTNFGPLYGTVYLNQTALGDTALVKYGRASAPSEYTCSDARVTEEFETIECSTAAGTGVDMVWTVYVGAADVFPQSSWVQASDQYASTINYERPSVSDVYEENGLSWNLTTEGGQTIIIEGENFGTDADQISVTYANDDGYSYTATDVTVLSKHTMISCATVAGIGANHYWSVNVSGQVSAPNGTTSYAAPRIVPLASGVVVAGQGASSASTSGEQRLVVYGKEFGEGTDNNEPIVTYGPTGVEFIASACEVTVDFTQITCLSAEGTGSGLMLRVNVGGQNSSVYPANISYAAPTIFLYDTQWNDAGGEGAYTDGGQWIAIQGDNFGAADQNAITSVTYGVPGFPSEYRLCGGPIADENCTCSVTVNHTWINCSMTEGAGKDMEFIVEISGLESTTPSVDYGLPVIRKLTGPGAENGLARGNQTVYVEGINFGNNETYLGDVTYGPGGVEYTAQDCELVSHTRVRCNTTDGVGADLYWTITIRDQTSDPSVANTSYAAPEILWMTFENASTEGGQDVTVYGTNFGAGVSGAFVQLYMDGSAIAIDGGTATRVLSDNTLGYLGTTTIDDVEYDFLNFVVPEMTTNDQKQIVQVRVGHTTISEVDQFSSNNMTFRYNSPLITTLSNKAASDSSTDIVLLGKSFGVGGELIANGQVYAYPDSCSTSSDLQCSWDHDRIQFTVSDTSGWIRVRVGTEVSNTVNFTSESPQVVISEDDYLPSNPYSTQTNKTLVILGINFGLIESAIGIYLDNPTTGTHTCEIVSGTLVEETVDDVDADDLKSVECYLPTGTGTENQLDVYVDDVLAIQGDGDASDQLYIEYRGPTIATVSPSTLPTTGGTITLTGRNFGDEESVVTITMSDVGVTTDYTNHTMLVAEVGEGQGTARRLKLDVDDQVDWHDDGVGFEPPTITDLIGNGSVATQGGLLNITGSNFGVPGNATVQSTTRIPTSCGSSVPAETVELTIVGQDAVNHSWIAVEIDEGQGSQDLIVYVADQSASETMAYAVPVLANMTPSSYRTEGGDRVTVTGSNFGIGVCFDLLFDGVWYTYADGVEDDFNVNVTHNRIEFDAPEGTPTSDSLDFAVRISGRTSNTLQYSYQEPNISYVADEDDPDTNVVRYCDENVDECPLTTAGGYTLVLVGDNFGLEDQTVYFDGTPIATDDFEVVDHQTIEFTAPAGVGADIVIYVTVGAYRSNNITFHYALPSISSVSPSDADGTGEAIEIFGSNFGEDADEADPIVYVGGQECSNVNVGSGDLSIWQVDADGDVYLWCETAEMTVGTKGITVVIGGQNRTYPASDEIVTLQCEAGYYGQEAWTAYTLSDGSCYEECTEEQEECMSKYNPENNTFTDPDCNKISPCKTITPLGTSTKVNCTVIDRYSEFCVECPDGSTCDGANSVYPAEPVADDGWWRLDVNANKQNCKYGHITRATCYSVVPCTPTDACVGDNTCKTGYTQERCSECCDEYNRYLRDDNGNLIKDDNGNKQDNPECYDDGGKRIKYYRFGGDCEECPSNPLLLLALFLVAALMVILGGYFLNKKQVNMGILSIGIDYFQVLSLFASTDIDWPSYLESLLSVLSLFSFNLNITAPECTFVLSFEVKWWIIELIPMYIAFGFFAVHLAKWGHKRCVKGKRGEHTMTHTHLMIGTSLMIFYYLYLFISQNTLEIFNCTEQLTEDGEKVGNKEYLEAAPEEACYESGSLQVRLLGPAIFFFFLYTVGYPAFVAYVLLKQDNAEMAREDQILRARGIGDDKTEVSGPAYVFRKRYSKLYYHFKPRYWYWVLVILARKFMLVSCALLFRENPTFQLCTMILVLFMAYALQVRNAPFMSEKEKEQIAMLYSDQLKAHEDTISHHLGSKRKKLRGAVRMGTDAPVTDDSRTASARKYLFNYNTVEAVLLFCAVLVNLFGIMFQSEFLDKGGFSYNALALTTILVITLSIVYYLCVVYYEIVIVLFPFLDCSCFGLFKAKDSSDQDAARAKKEKKLGQDALEESVFEDLTALGSADSLQLEQNPMAQGGIVGATVKVQSKEDELEQELARKSKNDLELTLKQLLEENRRLKKQMKQQSINRTLTPQSPSMQSRYKKKKKRASFVDEDGAGLAAATQAAAAAGQPPPVGATATATPAAATAGGASGSDRPSGSGVAGVEMAEFQMSAGPAAAASQQPAAATTPMHPARSSSGRASPMFPSAGPRAAAARVRSTRTIPPTAGSAPAAASPASTGEGGAQSSDAQSRQESEREFGLGRTSSTGVGEDENMTWDSNPLLASRQRRQQG